MRVQIGTGTDPFDDGSVVKAIEDDTNYVDDVYVRTSYMWLVMAGGKYSNVGHVDIIVTAILVSGEYSFGKLHLSLHCYYSLYYITS